MARQSRSGIFDYSTPLGPLDLRGLIQERMRLLGIGADANQILMTGGGSHSLDLLVRFLLEPGDVVFVESPGYYNLLGLLRLQRIKVVGVPRLADGPDIEHMEALLAQHQPKLFFVKASSRILRALSWHQPSLIASCNWPRPMTFGSWKTTSTPTSSTTPVFESQHSMA